MKTSENPAEAGKDKPVVPAGRIWQGTGLCCESQGDGVPCSGTAGECETCGKALPPAPPTGKP